MELIATSISSLLSSAVAIYGQEHFVRTKQQQRPYSDHDLQLMFQAIFSLLTDVKRQLDKND